MAGTVPVQAYTGVIREITLEHGGTTVTVGGETAYPFYTFEGDMPHLPKIAIEVPDEVPEEWAEACLAPWKDVMGDPVAWARKAQNTYQADIVFLSLKSTDPNGKNRSAEEAARTAKQVLEAIDVPLIVWGSANQEKDAEVLRAVAVACGDKKVCLGPVEEGNYRQIGAQALAYNHKIAASTPIDVNLAKQLNILLGNLGIAEENIIIDPTTGPIGYGIEYTYSVMERIRQAALTQQDDRLQLPILNNLAEEVWKCKEARQADDPIMGKSEPRGVLLEAMTAITLVLAGSDLVVMRHPEAIALVRNHIRNLAGIPKEVKEEVRSEEAAPVEATTLPSEAGAAVAANLPAGMRLDFDIARITDAPLLLGPDCMLAVVKISETDTGGISVSPGAVDVFSALLAARKMETAEAAEAAAVPKRTKKSKKVPEAPILKRWDVAEDRSGSYEAVTEKKEDFSGKHVELLGPTYEKGVPEKAGNWRGNLQDREEMIRFLRSSLRYWYAQDVFGSEKRKTPA
nr:acetyl-CoA decarbonylase/synthase complex subunit delta [Deltaproteobacteria bacterium]